MSSLLHTPMLTVPVSERDHVRGPETAPLTLLEYGDYECSYCGAAYPIVKQVERLIEGDRFAYRHFPLIRHNGGYDLERLVAATARSALMARASRES